MIVVKIEGKGNGIETVFDEDDTDFLYETAAIETELTSEVVS